MLKKRFLSKLVNALSLDVVVYICNVLELDVFLGGVAFVNLCDANFGERHICQYFPWLPDLRPYLWRNRARGTRIRGPFCRVWHWGIEFDIFCFFFIFLRSEARCVEDSGMANASPGPVWPDLALGGRI